MGIFYLFFKKVTLRTDADGKIARFRKRDMLQIHFQRLPDQYTQPQCIHFLAGYCYGHGYQIQLSAKDHYFCVFV